MNNEYVVGMIGLLRSMILSGENFTPSSEKRVTETLEYLDTEIWRDAATVSPSEGMIVRAKYYHNREFGNIRSIWLFTKTESTRPATES